MSYIMVDERAEETCPAPDQPRENWVNDVLDASVRTVSEYPEWMKRPEFW